ncbi:MAG: hypothetical protein K0R65_2312 [Crocinitomicaceae bacterium]|jgi:hypothetical protein|nr:hypothetical protein [Crocinitomicaceae bacterium]
MSRIISLSLALFFGVLSFGQKKDKMQLGRLLTENIGQIGNRFYYSTEKYPSGSKLIEYKKDISIAVYTKAGFTFFTEEDEIKNFPKGYVVSKNFIYKKKVYAIIGDVNKKEQKTDFRIIEMDSNLNIINDDFFRFTFGLKDVFGLKIKLDSNLLAVTSKSMLVSSKKEKFVETLGLDLETKASKYSKLVYHTENDLLFSDMTINDKLIVHLAYSSHQLDVNVERSKFKILRKVECLFARMDEQNSSLSSYDPHLNADFIPKNYKFLKINNNELYVASIAIPTHGTQMGYFVSKTNFENTVDFKNHQVIFPKGFTEPGFWRKKAKRRLAGGKCPAKYFNQNLEEVFIHDKQLYFITLEYNTYLKNRGYGSSTEIDHQVYHTDASGASYTTSTSSAISENRLHEGNFSFSVFDTAGFVPQAFFKTIRKSSYEEHYKYKFVDDALVVFFPIHGYSKEYGIKKKGGPMRRYPYMIKLEYQLKAKKFEYQGYRFKKNIYFEPLWKGHIVGNDLYVLHSKNITYNTEKKKFKNYKFKKEKKINP